MKKWENDLSVCHFFCFFLLFRFAFFLLFFCFCFAFILLFFAFCLEKNKIKANKKQIEKAKKNANGQVHVFPIFYPFCLSFFSLFFPFYFAFVFFGFCWFAFCFFHFFAFFALFFKLKKIRINGGLVNLIYIYIVYVGIPQFPDLYKLYIYMYTCWSIFCWLNPFSLPFSHTSNASAPCRNLRSGGLRLALGCLWPAVGDGDWTKSWVNVDHQKQIGYIFKIFYLRIQACT